MFIGQYTGRLSLAAIATRGEGRGGGLAKTLGPFSLIGLGIGCIIGAGIFVLTGKAAASYAGPGDHPVVRPGGHRLRLRRPVLRRTGRHDPRLGQRLHLCLCDRRRDLRLDHRLGSDPRIRHGRRDRGGRLVRLRRSVCSASFGIHLPPQWAQATGEVVKLADGTSATGILNLPAVADRSAAHRPADARHQGIGTRQQRHGGVQAVRRRHRHRRRRDLREQGELDPFIPRTPATSASSAGAASCAARRWCSSPISASTPSRPPRRRHDDRKRTCRSASWAR